MSFVMLDYHCSRCDAVFESLESRSAASVAILHPPCGGMAERTISAAHIGQRYGWVSQGKSDGPPSPKCSNTEPLASGMATGDWKLRNRKKYTEERRQQIKRELG